MRILRIAIAATLAAGAAVGAGVAAAAPAAADAGAIQYVSKTLNGPPGQKMFGTVGCPAGTFVVSASASTDGATVAGSSITSLTPLRSARTSTNLANYTSVAFTGQFGQLVSGGGAPMQVQAACAPAARLSNAVSRSITVAPVNGNRNGSRATVYCPAGMRAFGGGGYFLAGDNHYSTAAANMYENSVTADGTGWSFRGRTPAATDPLIVTTQCAPLAGSYTPSTSVPAPQQAPGYVTVGCAIGYTVLSGGVTFAHQDHTEGTGVVSSAWTSAGGVGAGGYTGGGSQLFVRAQCVPPGSF